MPRCSGCARRDRAGATDIEQGDAILMPARASVPRRKRGGEPRSDSSDRAVAQCQAPGAAPQSAQHVVPGTWHMAPQRPRRASSSTDGAIISRTRAASARTSRTSGSRFVTVGIGSCTTSSTSPGQVIKRPFFIT